MKWQFQLISSYLQKGSSKTKTKWFFLSRSLLSRPVNFNFHSGRVIDLWSQCESRRFPLWDLIHSRSYLPRVSATESVKVTAEGRTVQIGRLGKYIYGPWCSFTLRADVILQAPRLNTGGQRRAWSTCQGSVGFSRIDLFRGHTPLTFRTHICCAFSRH